MNGLETNFYYPSDEYPNTIGIGECRPGIKTCYDGQITDFQPILPQEEICDGKDNNCNGFIDDVDTSDPKAFFIILDVSGSMSDDIDTVKQAICAFAQADIAQNSLFALVKVSIGYNAPYISLVQDFALSQQTCDLMSASNFNTIDTIGSEYMLQGILLSSTIIWPDNMDKNIIAFTDEEIQMYSSVDQQNVLEQCQNDGYQIGVYSNLNYIHQWDTIVNTCGGFEDLLINDVQGMKQSLLIHFFWSC